MSFIQPVGNFVPSTIAYRPSSSIDTPNGGVINGSASAYDGDQSSYGIWYPPPGLLSKASSIFSFTGATILIDTKIYFDVFIAPPGSDTYTIAQDARMDVSIDNGATYPYSFVFSIGASDYTYPRQILSISLPGAITKSNIKIKFTSTVGRSALGTFSYIYDIYIQ